MEELADSLSRQNQLDIQALQTEQQETSSQYEGLVGKEKRQATSVYKRDVARLEKEYARLLQQTERNNSLQRAIGNNNKIFEWEDGALVQAMRQTGMVLIDEINMAEDSVLERLNSVLEIDRTLLITELN